MENEQYPKNWKHCLIHLNPDTGEMHSDGDHSVRQYIQDKICEKEERESTLLEYCEQLFPQTVAAVKAKMGMEMKEPECLLTDMLRLVVSAHEGQKDKAGKPYILHCLKVMNYLDTDDVQLQCIALGHDLLEDTKVTKGDILRITNSTRIMQGIDCLTRVKDETEEDYELKVMYNRDAIRVKICDLRHNLEIARLNEVTRKEVNRLEQYRKFYNRLKDWQESKY